MPLLTGLMDSLLNGGITAYGKHRCVLCNKEFSDRANCRRHLREKHLGLDHEACPLCGKVLGKRYIKEHVMRCKAMTDPLKTLGDD